MICAVFVYGTLKRGQQREGCWPARPHDILTARVRGTLFDLGPYPALQPGDDWVRGEIWLFQPEQMPDVLATLDAIEEFRNRPDDLYHRSVIECIPDSGPVMTAYTYHYVDTLADHYRIHPPPGSNEVSWLP